MGEPIEVLLIPLSIAMCAAGVVMALICYCIIAIENKRRQKKEFIHGNGNDNWKGGGYNRESEVDGHDVSGGTFLYMGLINRHGSAGGKGDVEAGEGSKDKGEENGGNHGRNRHESSGADTAYIGGMLDIGETGDSVWNGDSSGVCDNANGGNDLGAACDSGGGRDLGEGGYD